MRIINCKYDVKSSDGDGGWRSATSESGVGKFEEDSLDASEGGSSSKTDETEGPLEPLLRDRGGEGEQGWDLDLKAGARGIDAEVSISGG